MGVVMYIVLITLATDQNLCYGLQKVDNIMCTATLLGGGGGRETRFIRPCAEGVEQWWG